MSILNTIKPVNQNAVTSKTAINANLLELYVTDNHEELSHVELLEQLKAANDATPKLIPSATPTNVFNTMTNVVDLCKDAGVTVTQSNIQSVREITVKGSVVSVNDIAKGFLKALYADGKNTKPELASAYAVFLQNLADVVSDYSVELGATKESFRAINAHKVNNVLELEDITQRQSELEALFISAGTSHGEEKAKRDLEQKTRDMLADYDDFREWRQAQVTDAN